MGSLSGYDMYECVILCKRVCIIRSTSQQYLVFIIHLFLPCEVPGSDRPRHNQLLAGDDELAGPDQTNQVVPPQVRHVLVFRVLHKTGALIH
jgi:hypothetical protein